MFKSLKVNLTNTDIHEMQSALKGHLLYSKKTVNKHEFGLKIVSLLLNIHTKIWET